MGRHHSYLRLWLEEILHKLVYGSLYPLYYPLFKVFPSCLTVPSGTEQWGRTSPIPAPLSANVHHFALPTV